MLNTFERLESEVRGYIRDWPTVFVTARGARMTDQDEREFIDFFAGAGVLNYGHNDSALKQALIDYLAMDGVVHSLDMGTHAKRIFLERFESLILRPRSMEYKIQFPGPTGTNAVEAALKLARKVTGRTEVVSFWHGFHGMTTAALAVTGNAAKRAGASVPLTYATSFPYDGDLGPDFDTTDLLDRALSDPSSGLDTPAAVIVETVQGEGGMRAASFDWLRRLEQVCRKHELVLIVDDIQAGCGRAGTFFSFEPSGIQPDIICLSKSLSGFGLPMALTLIRPDLDQWNPGEHNGTFRGNNAAFVTATAALERFWRDAALCQEVERKAALLHRELQGLAARHSDRLEPAVRGRGLMQGVAALEPGFAGDVIHEAFRRGLILETSGARGEVVKCLPPLTIDDGTLLEGLAILQEATEAVASGAESAAVSAASGGASR